VPRFDKDYYKLLGVAETATPEEIRRAFRAKAKDLHPDRAKGDKAKEALFKEVNEANAVLSDEKKRSQYDQMRKAGVSGDPSEFFRQAQGGQQGDFDMGDLMSSFFDMGAMGRKASARTRSGRGEDTAASIHVPFETAAKGGRITITVPQEESCKDCRGTGAKGGGKTCRECQGSGMAARQRGGFAVSRPCTACGGRGTEPSPPCPSCHGEGTKAVTRTLEVKVPAGAASGNRLRLSGEGAPGPGGGPPGDLLLELIVGAGDFEREGRDLTSTVEIPFTDAILGTELQVPTLHGSVKVRVPAGTQPGARLRLSGQGIQGADGDAGDHYVRIKVRLPKTVTEEQKKALDTFRIP